MFYCESIHSVARRAREKVLEAMGTGLLDEDDDALEAGIEAAIEQAIQPTEIHVIDPAQWRVECEVAVFTLYELVTLSGRQRSTAACLELLRSVPRAVPNLSDVDLKSMLGRYVTEAFERRGHSGRLPTVLTGLERIAALPEASRSLLDACVAGMLVGWGTGG